MELPVKRTEVRYPLHILLVDDYQINLIVARNMLRKMGYAAEQVSCGQEALEAFSRCSYDLVLMDIYMPVMDGLECSRRIMSLPQAAGCKIVAVTASVISELPPEYSQAGIVDVLDKPITLDKLAGMIEKWGSRIHADKA